MEDFVICNLCNKKFAQITETHLKKYHQITVKEYKNRFGNCEIISLLSAKKISENAKELIKLNKIGFKKGHQTNQGKIPWNKGMHGICKSWSKGLTKETNDILFNASIKCSNTKKRLFQEGKIERPIGIKNGMYGKKITESHKFILWNSWKNRPTKPEKRIITSFSNWKYTGDGKFWLKFKDGTYKNPDFILQSLQSIDNNYYKIAIEVFGDYWHRNDNPNDIIEKYNEIGWRCIIIWEKEINELDDYDLFDKIDRFINYDIYDPIVSHYEENYGIHMNLLSEEIKEGLI